MNTPIIDFITKYKKSKGVRLHMPAHKGNVLGCEMDITEIVGADSLFDACGIIDESEKNLSSLFNTNFSVYSTEGSTLSIKTMLALVKKYAKDKGQEPLILSARNAHSSFLYGVSLLDIEVEWLNVQTDSFLSCILDESTLENKIKSMKVLPTALYITSPDYLGNLLPISELSNTCKKYGVLLIVDNAHGSYLNFLNNNLHPIYLGADMCCDSAHKTLPTLTGGGYLHISKNFDVFTKKQVKNLMKIFASTSPSYLILASLDWTNKYLYKNKTAYDCCSKKVQKIKEFCVNLGLKLVGNEPLKITLSTKSYGYLGGEIAKILQDDNIFVEYFDSDYVVLMFSPLNRDKDYKKLKTSLLKIPKKQAIEIVKFNSLNPIKKMQIKEALFSPNEKIQVEKAKGKIISSINISCPPAVPILLSGEVVDDNAVDIMKYYGIKDCYVVKE